MLSDDHTLSGSVGMLARMMAHTQAVVEQRKQEISLAGMRALAGMQSRPFDLSSRLRNHPGISLIAQIKRRAPDMDKPIEDYDLAMLATRFESLHAAALMVATNEQYYHSGIADLTIISRNMSIPVIRQDFVYDEYQIIEARAAGADGVLLIAALLNSTELRDLISMTQRNRMTAVVQVHNEEELRHAIAFEPRVIAINNRDIETLQVDLARTLHLRPLIPRHMAVISMGGIRTAQDVAMLQQAEVHAAVIGQALLTAPDTAAATRELFKLAHEETL